MGDPGKHRRRVDRREAIKLGLFGASTMAAGYVVGDVASSIASTSDAPEYKVNATLNSDGSVSGKWSAAGTSTTTTTVPSGSGGGTMVGDSLYPATYGESHYGGTVPLRWESLVGRPCTVRRVYFRVGDMPTNVPANLLLDARHSRAVALSFRPAFNPPREDHYNALVSFCAAAKAANLQGQICLWHEAGPRHMTATQFTSMWRFYAGAVDRSTFPLAWVMSQFAVVKDDVASSYWPGADLVDVVATDFYADGWSHWGVTLEGGKTSLPQLCQEFGKPLSLWEFAASEAHVTTEQMQQFYSYLSSFGTDWLSSGKSLGYVLHWSGNTGQGPGQYGLTTADSFQAAQLQACRSLFDAVSPV